MNCREFWDTLPQGVQDAPGEHGAHLTGCADCAARWEKQRAVGAGLSVLAADERRVEAPARVESGLMAAFRAQVRHGGRQSAWARWAPVLVWSWAAAAMLVTGFVLVHGWQPNQTPPTSVSEPHRAVEAGPELAALPAVLTIGAAEDESVSGLGDGFIRLPNAAPIQPNEDVNLVRVEVSSAQLAALGFTVSEDRGAAPVLAEFALGPDGLAHAVRFVNDEGKDD